jgi:ferredoxin
LDPDPHFRKIELVESDCVLCGACTPVCPTQAILETKGPQGLAGLAIEQPLCYGCGRCVAVCPTEALRLNPFLQEEQIQQVLKNPWVEAVEIHTRYADPYMLPEFLSTLGPQLTGKIISVCFRPNEVETGQWVPFLEQLNGYFQERQPELPLMIQIDGQPMSGSDDPKASLPALKSARAFYQLVGQQYPYITISGGINRQTSEYLKAPDYNFIAGVGMGTVARKAVWSWLDSSLLFSRASISAVNAMVRPFKSSLKFGIINEETVRVF